MNDLPRQDLVVFYDNDRDVAVPVFKQGDLLDPDVITGATVALKIDDLIGAAVMSIAGTVGVAPDDNLAIFPLLHGSVFGTAANRLQVGQYRYAVIVTLASRPNVVAHGYLTVVAAAGT